MTITEGLERHERYFSLQVVCIEHFWLTLVLESLLQLDHRSPVAGR